MPKITPHTDAKGLYIGSHGSSFARAIYLANPDDGAHRYVFAFGAYSPTYVLAWGRGLEDALENAADWLEDHAPGYFCDDYVEEEYRRALAEGKSESEAIEEAESDTITLDGCRYLASHEWMILAEDPDRATLQRLIDGN